MRRNACLMLLLFAGCATVPGRGPDTLERDGQEYGAVEGTFRGRWWNYYERGRSFLDGGFVDEATADMNTALAFRAEDQRWARTYGLHFIPEYFPNRELGIALFQQGKLDEAAQRLETSLSQERSALAEHYLNQVRAAQVSEAGGDTTPPVITAEVSPQQGDVPGFGGTVHVALSDNTYVATLSINDETWPLGVAKSQFNISAPLNLADNANAVMITAVDIAGNRAEITLDVPRDHDGPAISFDAPATPGLVSGMANDATGIREIRIGDSPVALETLPGGGVRFSAPVPDASLRFSATDTLGNATEGALPLASPAQRTAAVLRQRVQLAGDVEPAWIAQALAVAQAALQEDAGIRFENLAEGQRYLMDEIVVSIEAHDPDGIAAIQLDGAPMDGLVPNAQSLRVSRRIRLADFGARRVVATLTDATGATSETAVTIEREATSIEEIGEHLRVALLGNLWEGAGPKLENETAFVAEELSRAIFDRKRFDIVSRDALPRVLEEQELRTVLGSRDLAPALRQIVPADVLAVGKVRRTGDTMEIVLQAVSSETSNILAYADVAGPVDNLDDLRALARDLALRFEQEFPRATGTVVNAPASDRCFTTLAEADRVRPQLPCIVYRYGDPVVHPQTGAVLGRPTEIIARGQLAEVQAQMSRIALGATEGGQAVQVDDHVAMR